MTRSFLLDEHVPRVVETALRSEGHAVERADDVFGQGTVDRELLAWCDSHGSFLLTNDKKDYVELSSECPHCGVFIYTSQNWARDNPGELARTVDVVLDHYSPDDLAGEIVWLDQWRGFLQD